MTERLHAAEPLYLEGEGATGLFAMVHHAQAAPSGRGVLICPPFGWEDMCSYRSRRDWAELLAREGHTTVRFDFPASGDSAGAPGDEGLLDAWTQAVSAAARWLLDTGAASSVAAIGIGMGGLIACRAAMLGAPIEELVLWSVPGRGRTLLRELRAFSAMEVAYIPDSAAPGGPAGDGRSADGALVANGYLLSAQTAAELEGVDLQELSRLGQGPRRALLLGRDGLKVDDRVRDALERTGAAVASADGPGYAAMMVEPQEAVAPTEVFATVSAWLAERDSAAEKQGALAARTHGEDEDSGESRDGPAAGVIAAASTSARAELTLDSCGVQVRETPLYLGRPDGALFGVLTEPLGPRRELCAVLLNAGPQRRTGPNRMWVELARRWAAQGVPSLRFDLGGIGDSEGDAAALVQVAALYAPEYVEQARTALDSLSARGLPARFLVLGLCSGAYWAAHAALADERIAAVVMLNPRALVWDEWVYTVRRTRELRERVLLASTWRKVLRGEITLARHLEIARAIAGRAASSPRRVLERIGASRRGEHKHTRERETNPAEAIFDALADRGQRATMLFTGAEPLHRELEDERVLERLERWPDLELRILGTSADTHTLTPIWLQRQVHELLDVALARELEELPRD